MLYQNWAKKYAAKYGYMQREQKDPNALIFWKPGAQLNVFFTTCTIAVILDEPGKPRQPVYLRDVGIDDMGKVFEDAPAYMKFLNEHATGKLL